MRILINAITTQEGGGLVVLTRHLDEFIKNADLELYVIVHNKVAKFINNPNVVTFSFAGASKSSLHLLYWYEITLPKLIKKIKPTVFLSFTGYLPHRTSNCPSLLLVQNAGYFSAEFQRAYSNWYSWYANFRWRQKQKWLAQSMRHATGITVQTNALKEAIIKIDPVLKDRVYTIHHGTGLLTSPAELSKVYPKATIWRIGYITKFGVQKEFDTIFRAIKLLSDEGLPVRLVLTLAEDTKEFSAIKELLTQLDIIHLVENKGEVTNPEHLAELYQSLAIFVFPSSCESFGFTLVEAMTMGLPVIISNTSSNCELAPTQLIFQLRNAAQLAEKIKLLISNPVLYEAESQKNLARSKLFCWKKAATDLLSLVQTIAAAKVPLLKG